MMRTTRFIKQRMFGMMVLIAPDGADDYDQDGDGYVADEYVELSA